MAKFKRGDRVIVVKEMDIWSLIGYALKGWTGVIEGVFSDIFSEAVRYVIKWEKKENRRGNLIEEDMIKLIEPEKKTIKEFGIVKFMRETSKERR